MGHFKFECVKKVFSKNMDPPNQVDAPILLFIKNSRMFTHPARFRFLCPAYNIHASSVQVHSIACPSQIPNSC